jgi:diguanylate cyclase (GGDEF)-like protein/PAS domain S-box-containing protein
MGSTLNDISAEALEQIERARARATRRAERREYLTEAALALVFLALSALAATVFTDGRAGWGTAVLLTVICALLARVEFEVGEGLTRPIQLAIVPMLVLLPAGLVPFAVIAAHLPATLLKVARGQAGPQRLLLTINDAAFSLAPALVMGLAPDDAGLATTVAFLLAANVAFVAGDLALATIRLWVGLGLDPRPELRGFAWVYAVDLALAPIGLLAALAGEAEPALLTGVLPLAALLTFFARERRGRIENAMELQRVAQESRERLQTIVRNSSDCIMIVSAEGAIETLTGAVDAVFGDAWEAAQDTPLLDYVDPQDAAVVRAFLSTVAAKGADERPEAEWRMRYADGSFRYVAAVATNLAGDDRLRGVVLTIRDVHDRKAFEEQLRHRAFHDALTGLANRPLFYDRIEHALTRGARADAQVGVLFVDLDDFKQVNDGLGHAEGDRLLQEVARRLETCLRSGDTAARLGGDEFGVLLEDVAGPDAVTAAAARVLEALAEPFELGGREVFASASVGMALSTPQDRGVEEFLRKADLAMYEAKRAGKHRAELYAPELDRGPDGRDAWFARNDEQRAEIEAVLRDPDAIRIVFQPIMDLRTGRVGGYESLSRFTGEPRRGPDQWFAQAHRCGLGYELEAHAIALALATPGRPAGTYLSVNMSPSSLLSETVLRVLPERLDGIVIEITENELVSGDQALLEALDGLRRRGARLAVDDVGAGYAGLTHVMRLQPDIIKLDRALTTGVDTDPAKAPLISSFVRYARDIDAAVCAEGVETLAELERLADLDVSYGQGYGIARPAAPWPEAALEATAACLYSFQATLAGDGGEDLEGADHDRRLERLARRVSGIGTEAELEACLPALAAELQADEVRIVGAGPGARDMALQELADDAGGAELRAAGYGSRLTLPITRGDELLGYLEAYALDQRPWSRFHIGRARVLSYQLGALAPVARALRATSR